jgi:hypothetical protein
MTEPEQQEVLEYIREYLKYWELNGSLELLEEELKHKVFSRRTQGAPKRVKQGETRMDQLLRCGSAKSKNEVQLERENREKGRKYQEVLQAGRQIFSVSINLLQIIHNIKESSSRYEALNETIENYKIQLGKHHKVIINEGRVEGSELISESVIKDHKAKLEQYFADRNVEGIIEILLSLRVNALQIAPELRKSLVEELIRRDIFRVAQGEGFDFLMDILNIKNKSLRHAVTSLISVIVSTLRGIEYLTAGGADAVVLDKVIKVLPRPPRYPRCDPGAQGAGQRQRDPALLPRHPPEVLRQGEPHARLLGQRAHPVGPPPRQEEPQHEGARLLPGLRDRHARERGPRQVDAGGAGQAAGDGRAGHRDGAARGQGAA